MDNRPRVVILGAGFAGVSAARGLVKLLPRDEDCDIVLVDRNSFLLFTPMLTELAGGEIDAEDTVVSVRRLSPRVTFIQGRVIRIDAPNRRVTVELGGEGAEGQSATRTLEADHLVIALGSETNYHGIPGLQEHSLQIKTVDQAAAIRNRALALLERANAEPDESRRRQLLTFVVAGGGFSGVETMAALNDLVRDAAPLFHDIDRNHIRTIVAHPGKRLLPEISEGLAEYAQKQLESRGVRVALNTKVTGASENRVKVDPPLDGMAEIPAHLLVWAGGVTPSPVIEKAGAKVGHHHGLVVDECCQVVDLPGVWAIGDCAEIPEKGKGKTYAPTAQNAMREGPQVARNIVACMRGGTPEPFEYTPIGELALVGKRSGVASVYGIHLAGFPAWLMWRTVYLLKIPRLSKRLRVAAAWLLDLIFGREIVELHGAG